MTEPRTSPNYRNKRFADAIAIWSGHNSVESYISFVLLRTPGMTRGSIMDDAFWCGPLAIPFLKNAGMARGRQTVPQRSRFDRSRLRATWKPVWKGN
jgi:hypothetical protein